MKFEDVKMAVNYVTSKNKKGIIAIRSTIMPGMTDEFIKGYKREFVYLPEFLRERTAFLDETCPDKIIIGTKKGEVFEIFRRLFKRVVDSCPLNAICPKDFTMELARKSKKKKK